MQQGVPTVDRRGARIGLETRCGGNQCACPPQSAMEMYLKWSVPRAALAEKRCSLLFMLLHPNQPAAAPVVDFAYGRPWPSPS